MVAVPQRKEEFKPQSPKGGVRDYYIVIIVLKGSRRFILKKGARFIFYDFLPIVAPLQKKSK